MDNKITVPNSFNKLDENTKLEITRFFYKQTEKFIFKNVIDKSKDDINNNIEDDLENLIYKISEKLNIDYDEV
jgi:hypothetical protein